jgi:hypothetical protein
VQAEILKLMRRLGGVPVGLGVGLGLACLPVRSDDCNVDQSQRRAQKIWISGHSRTDFHQKYAFTHERLGEGGEGELSYGCTNYIGFEALFHSVGIVKTVQSKITNDKFAVKSIRKKRTGNYDGLLQEIDMLSSCDHPNIVKLVDVCEDRSHIYLVEELCTGGDLFDSIVERGNYTEHHAKRVMHELLYAVAYCHKQGIVHR